MRDPLRSTGEEEIKAAGRQPDEDMQGLLGSEPSAYRSVRRGEIIEGTIVEISRNGILVDIGTKSEGIVPITEVQSLGPEVIARTKVGDVVLVYVLQPENQEGQVVLSLNRAWAEKGWHLLQQYFENGELFEAEVVDYNKGGLIVNVEGVRAFVPSSQVTGVRPNGAAAQAENPLLQKVGKKLRLKVIEINRRRNRVILSERVALQEWRMQQRERLLGELHQGEIRRGVVTSVREFGAFVDLGGADGLAHISELSWERVEDPREIVKVGDEVDVYVLNVDAESKKIALSLRRAQRAEPWAEVASKYHVGQLVMGTVTKLTSFGAFARIEGPVEGLVHVSELADRRILHPKEVVKEGDALTLKILRIEPERRRLGLSLRQAQDGTSQ